MLLGLCIVVAAIAVTLLCDALAGHSRVLAAPGLVDNTFVVNSTADTVDADVGDGICADASGHCTLRAAILQANFIIRPDVITLPAGVFQLNRAGDDDAAVLGDLDITDDLTIQGADSGAAIVDGNGAVTGDRVFQVLPTAKNTSFSGLTIRNGKKIATFDEGGGLEWQGDGSHLSLNAVTIESNTAYDDGGLSLRYSTIGDVVDMDHVIVRANTATAAVGGLGADLGIFGGFSLRNSQVYSNTAYEGGGLYFQGPPPGSFTFLSTRIENTAIYSNTASLSAGMENHSGDAAHPIVLANSQIYQNHASFYGGAVGNYGTLVISDTVLENNSAEVRGGGVYDYEGGQLDIRQSTLSGNTAQYGGGIYSEFFLHGTASAALTNSTISGNTASRDGGGIFAQGGQIRLFNSTIASNNVLVPLGTSYGGLGGGLYITATALVDIHNTILADNTHRYQALPPEPDDCRGVVTSLGFNLIEMITLPCAISGNTTGNVTGMDPLLGPLRNNGGPTKTQALLKGSPAIDAGQTPCLDATNTLVLTTDQRGFARPFGAQCDIGAVEYYPLKLVFLPLIDR